MQNFNNTYAIKNKKECIDVDYFVFFFLDMKNFKKLEYLFTSILRI